MKSTRKKSRRPAASATPDRREATPVSPPPAGPKPLVRSVLSVWVCLHLFALLISFTSVVEPSTVHARLNQVLQPYLRPTHFSADDRPVYLTYGDASDQPLRLQVTRSELATLESLPEDQWRTVGPDGENGLAVSDRRVRWLATASLLAQNEQPGLVAELLLPVVRDNEVTAIRLRRLPTELSDVNAAAETPYLARVVRDGGTISLVQLRADRLSARAVGATGGDGE